MLKLPAQILVDVLSHCLQMPANSVWLRDQNKKIPNDNGLYIVVGNTSEQTLSNVTSIQKQANPSNWDEPGATWDQPNQPWDQTNVVEVSEIVQLENIQIDILSRSNEALLRKTEIIAALQSIYSQQQQEANNFKIFRLPRSFINASSAEGGSNINRYSATVTCHALYRKTTILTPPGDYYDDFRQRVDDDKTIGTNTPLIEFEINSGGIIP